MLSILEPAIVNDENVTIAIHLELVEILQDFMLFALEDIENNKTKKFEPPPVKASKSTKSGKGAKQTEPELPVEPSTSAPLYLKLLIRCLTSCLRLDLGV